MIGFLGLAATIGALSWVLLVWIGLLALTSLVSALSWLPWVLLAAWLGAVVYYRLHRPTNLRR